MNDQPRLRSTTHEAPGLGDLGHGLTHIIASSVFVAESSDFVERG